MTREEANTYWFPVLHRHIKRKPYVRGGHTSTSECEELAKILGLEYPRFQNWKFIELSDDLRHTLQALLGPHGDTIFQVLVARQKGD